MTNLIPLLDRFIEANSLTYAVCLMALGVALYALHVVATVLKRKKP